MPSSTRLTKGTVTTTYRITERSELETGKSVKATHTAAHSENHHTKRSLANSFSNMWRSLSPQLQQFPKNGAGNFDRLFRHELAATRLYVHYKCFTFERPVVRQKQGVPLCRDLLVTASLMR